jgi:hypothetical protein
VLRAARAFLHISSGIESTMKTASCPLSLSASTFLTPVDEHEQLALPLVIDAALYQRARFCTCYQPETLALGIYAAVFGGQVQSN